jgi:hypothetical protein
MYPKKKKSDKKVLCVRGLIYRSHVANFRQNRSIIANFRQNRSIIANFRQNRSIIANLQQNMSIIANFRQHGSIIANFRQNRSIIAHFRQNRSIIANFRQNRFIIANFRQNRSIIANFRQPSLKLQSSNKVSLCHTALRIPASQSTDSKPSAQTFGKHRLESFQALRSFRHYLPVQPHLWRRSWWK